MPPTLKKKKKKKKESGLIKLGINVKEGSASCFEFLSCFVLGYVLNPEGTSDL